MRPDILDAGPVLLYDGTCGFCAESVQLVLRHDRRKTLRFASLQGELGRAIRTAHPELDAVDSMVWVDRDPAGGASRVLVRSDAGLRIAGYVGGWWRLAIIGRLAPRVARDGIYGLIARHRHRLMGSGPTCLVPAPDVRERFLDRLCPETRAALAEDALQQMPPALGRRYYRERQDRPSRDLP